MEQIRHVGVVGAGLAGLAVSLAAASAGLSVDVFETRTQAWEPNAHVDVVPNLMRDLARLGVADACCRVGFPYQGFAVLNGDGATQFVVPTHRLAGDFRPAALGMLYGDLLRLLHEAATSKGVRVHYGAKVEDVRADEIRTADGARHSVCLPIVASGEDVPTIDGQPACRVPTKSLPQEWHHCIVPRPKGLDQASLVIGPRGSKLMAVPIDTRRAGVALMRPLAQSTSAVACRDEMFAEGALLRTLATHWRDDSATLVRRVRSGLLERPWHHQGVLRVGQSTRVLPPHFGQAAAQAVEDAVVLGELLQARMARSELLDAFHARRHDRAKSVHALVTQAARWNLKPDGATDLRDLTERLFQLVDTPA